MTRILEVNEEGALVIPADLLNGAEPHERFTAESAGKTLVLRPNSDLPKRHRTTKMTSEDWDAEWTTFAERVTKVWPKDKSAIDVISEMRR